MKTSRDDLPAPGLWDDEQTAAYLGVSVRTVQRLPIPKVRISTRRVGRRPSDVEAYLTARTEAA
jgi:hypothetical protein